MRAVLFLGREYGNRPVPADEIADAIGAPANYLSKTLNALAKAGIAISTAGRQGGFSLALAPDRITIEQIIDVFEPRAPVTRCLLGNRPCNRDAPCAAHRRWMSILSTYRGALSSTTVAELLAG